VTHLLQQAIAEIQKLPDTDQDAIAALILEELTDEQRWREKFAASQDELSRMAEKVRGDIQAGRVRDAGFDEL
jgi:hypothetical protein